MTLAGGRWNHRLKWMSIGDREILWDADGVDAHNAFDDFDLSGVVVAPGLDIVVRGVVEEGGNVTLSVEGRKPAPNNVIRLDVDGISKVDPACLVMEIPKRIGS